MESNGVNIYLFIISTFFALCLSKTIPQISTGTSALLYLTRFGYLDEGISSPRTAALIDSNTIRKALLEFQAFADLPLTGQVDDQTLEMMNTKRCGNKDFVGYGSRARRKKRYALQGSRWRVRNLTYKITKYPRLLTKAQTKRDISKAFDVWSGVTNLTFTEAVGNAKIHIEIRFESGEHGDGDPFDGSGGTLAHAYFPIYGGDAHFDESEAWTVLTFKGTNLFQVAAHELGHSLGLSHSDVRSALMAPFYRGYQPTFKLHSDDIQAIQSLYGKKEDKVTSKKGDKPTTDDKPTFTNDSSPMCVNSKIDAIVRMNGNQKVFVFKGADYWRLTDDGIATGFPRKIADDFQGLPSNIDAAFSWNNGRTYFFKGPSYWRMTDMVVDPGYPRPISKGFAGIPSNIQAAFVWSGNGKIYFFKNDKYWRFDPTQRPPVKEVYPKPIKNWVGLPNGIDDAVQYTNGYTYFFKEGQYWRFNDRRFRVDVADPPFPRAVGPWWFGCQKKSQLNDEERNAGSVDNTIGTDEVGSPSDAVSGPNSPVDTSGRTR